MPVDLPAAERFLAGHARALDRRRFELIVGGGDPQAVLAALDAYRNPDGGYGWGLEPDLRAPGSQPIAALHAFEAMHEAGVDNRRAVELCDWLASVSLSDGGLPFVLPIEDGSACAPWFTGADPTTSSLHGTLAVASAACRLPAVATHPWLEGAVRFCLDGIAAAERLSAHETMYALRFLDAVGADDELARVAATVPPSGALPVEGGLEDEALRPLDYAPDPDGRVRRHVDAELVARDLERVAGGQQADGGWSVDFASFSPAAALEWRGYATVAAVAVLVRNRVAGPRRGMATA